MSDKKQFPEFEDRFIKREKYQTPFEKIERFDFGAISTDEGQDFLFKKDGNLNFKYASDLEGSETALGIEADGGEDGEDYNYTPIYETVLGEEKARREEIEKIERRRMEEERRRTVSPEERKEHTVKQSVIDTKMPPSKALLQRVKNIADESFSLKKNFVKYARTIFQFGFLAAVVALVAWALMTFGKYEPFGAVDANSPDNGFIALSYFGVERYPTPEGDIGIDLIREHFQGLADSGYVAITQQDIIDYYTKDKLLPPKSLYLIFEMGKRDTAINVQGILEKHNYKATMFTYAETLNSTDPNFLNPGEIRDMEKTTYWESGSQGYRPNIINAFDRYDRYLGQLDMLRFAALHSTLSRRYNHYLMDYLRDENLLPIETHRSMANRIGHEYENMETVYKRDLGYLPKTYAILHANTGRFGNNPQVSDVNEYYMRKLFSLNFNREGLAVNRREHSRYDLTRTAVQNFWPVNHLLMRITHDNHLPVKWKTGDEGRAKKWRIKNGVAEFKDEAIILTTEPESSAVAELLGDGSWRDLDLKVSVTGSSYGTQKIYLRSDAARQNYLAVEFYAGRFIVTEAVEGKVKEIFNKDLREIDGVGFKSIEEDKRDTLVTELEAYAKYAADAESAADYLKKAAAAKDRKVRTVAEGGEPYIPVIPLARKIDRDLNIHLAGDSLSIEIDKKIVVDTLLSNDSFGGVYLAAGWENNAFAQSNVADDVYDAIFDKLLIKDASGKEIVNLEFTGWEKRKAQAIALFDAAIGMVVGKRK